MKVAERRTWVHATHCRKAPALEKFGPEEGAIGSSTPARESPPEGPEGVERESRDHPHQRSTTAGGETQRVDQRGS